MSTEVTVDELDAARSAGAHLIDVREADEYAEGHVPGAQLMPLAVVPLLANELPGKTPVYVICASGGRSAQATQILSRIGIDARSVAGGTNAWIRSGRPIDTGAPRP